MALIRNTAMLVLSSGLLVGSYFVLTKNPCDTPLSYRIGTFDAKFGISKADFLADVARAEKIWEVPSGKQLFAYDPKGRLPINLMYDNRQATADKNKVLATNISNTQATADSVRAKFESLKSSYEISHSEYEALINQFESDLKAYNAETAAWNAKGGAPQAEYDKLAQERIGLEQLRAQAEAKLIDVNSFARQVNDLINTYNYLVNTENLDIHTINQGANKEFEQGEYVSDAAGQRIDVYEFGDQTKLVRLLAHEMGHALGLDHNANPDSIMYYLNKGTSLKLSSDDIKDLKKACKIK